jgi:hypothetical protein
MKKYLITLLLLIPIGVYAFTPATLFRGNTRVAVKTQTQAQQLFSQGYQLEQKLGVATSSVPTPNPLLLGTNTWTGKNTFSSTTAPTILNGGFLNTASSTMTATTTFTGTVIGVTKFGGTAEDGTLNVTTGTTTLNAASAKVLVKNYSSINISAGATTTISNPNAAGTILILKSRGNCVIAGAIDLTGMGAASTTNSWGIMDDSANHQGQNGGNGNGSNTAGTAGAAGTIFTNKFSYLTADSSRIYRRTITILPGNGGGNGGNGYENPADILGGSGGRGGGGLIIQCGGYLTFTGVINLNGGAGLNGSTKGSAKSGGGGGGGGGSAGFGLILYNFLSTNSGTINAIGGKGGDGGTGYSQGGGGNAYSGGGSGGGAGDYTVAGAIGKVGGISDVGVNGDNSTYGAGASGGSGGGANTSDSTVYAGGTGGTTGTTDTNHYLVIKNTEF